MATYFFSPKSRMRVSRPVALSLNTLNMLAPILLLGAVVAAIIARFGGYSPDINRLLLKYAAILVVLSIFIRIIWGVFIHMIKKGANKRKG